MKIFRWTRLLLSRKPAGERCGMCSYSRVGLAVEAPCPECGASAAATRPFRRFKKALLILIAGMISFHILTRLPATFERGPHAMLPDCIVVFGPLISSDNKNALNRELQYRIRNYWNLKNNWGGNEPSGFSLAHTRLNAIEVRLLHFAVEQSLVREVRTAGDRFLHEILDGTGVRSRAVGEALVEATKIRNETFYVNLYRVLGDWEEGSDIALPALAQMVQDWGQSDEGKQAARAIISHKRDEIELEAALYICFQCDSGWSELSLEWDTMEELLAGCEQLPQLSDRLRTIIQREVTRDSWETFPDINARLKALAEGP